MTKRKGKYAPPPEIHERLKEHINCSSRISEAIQNRDDWARKGLAWSSAGKVEKARQALQKAQWWDAQRLQWEKRRKVLEE